MKAVFDTNVLIAAFLTEGLCWKILARANRKEFDLFVSPYILAELKNKLSHKFNLSGNEVTEVLNLIKEISISVDPQEKGITVKGACRDRKDDLILACAIAAEADYLVTGDPDLITLRSYKKVKIINPREFETIFTKT